MPLLTRAAHFPDLALPSLQYRNIKRLFATHFVAATGDNLLTAIKQTLQLDDL